MAKTIEDLARLLAALDTDERCASFRHSGAWHGIVTILDYLVARDGQGTPTPVEPTPPSAEKDTPMERSMTGQQDKHTPTPPENFSSERGPYWPYVYSPSSPEKFFDLAGSLVWDPGCGLDRPVGYLVGDRVDVLLRDGTLRLNCRVSGLNWHECGGGSIIRYRRRAGADLSQSGYAAGQGVAVPEVAPVLPDGWSEWHGRWKQRWPSGVLATDFIDVLHRDGSISANVCVGSVDWTWSSVRGSPQERDVLGWRRHVPAQKLEIQKTHEGFMKRDAADPDNGPDGAFGPDVVGDAGYRLSEWILRAALADELLALPDDAEKLSWVGVCSAINSAILRSRGS